jgi:hypothetical protein
VRNPSLTLLLFSQIVACNNFTKSVPTILQRTEINLISAEIKLDSVSEEGYRLTTFELSLPKQLLAQLNTHRSLSKNAASSRAIPTKKFKESILETPVIPVWTYNQPGMIGKRIENQSEIDELDAIWLETRDMVIAQVNKLVAKKCHKQTANRLLEPWFYAKIVCSATDLDWFYYLRDSGSAQEEIAILARAMREAQEKSTPILMKPNQWHIPYILPDEKELDISVLKKISVARCARVSYKTHDDDLLSTIEKDLKLYQQLYDEKHMSPFEHSATPAMTKGYRGSNFKGWVQLREFVQP